MRYDHKTRAMTEYTTIRVSKAAKESAQEAKKDGETWNDYLQRCTDTPPSVTEFVPVEDVVGRDVPQSKIDYVEIETRCKSAIKEVLSK